MVARRLVGILTITKKEAYASFFILNGGLTQLKPILLHIRAHRVVRYSVHMKDGCIRHRMERPDWSDLPKEEYDWDFSVCGNATEEIPTDAPEPLGKFVDTATHADANLLHDMISGKSCTGSTRSQQNPQ